MSGFRWTSEDIAAFDRRRKEWEAKGQVKVRTHVCQDQQSKPAKAWLRAQVKSKIRKCGICGTEFTVQGSRNTYCSETCSAKAEKRRQQAGNSGVGSGGTTKGKALVPRRVCEVCSKEFWAPPVLIKRGGGRYCSVACRASAMSRDPTAFPQTKTRRGNGGTRADLGCYYRSAWEANYARYLNWLLERGAIREWTYEPETFEFHNIKRGSRFYTPDFRVINKDGLKEYHEVKGYMDQKSATKLRRFRRYYPTEKLVLIDKSAYHAIARTVKPLIPAWEGRVRQG